MGADNLRGVALMLGAMALFALEDMFLKWAALGLPTGELVFVAGIFGMPFFAVLARREGGRLFGPGLRHPAVIARNLGEMVGSLGYITALATVPLSTVAAVLQAMPLVVTMAAALFMQAQVGWRRWSAITVGLLGVLLVVQPGTDGFRPQAMWVLVTVLALTLRDLATRAIPPGMSNALISAWGLGSVALLGFGMMLVQGYLGLGQAAVPSGFQAALLTGAVVFGAAGYWAITAAARTGEVAVVAPFRYSRLLFAMVIGMLVFAEFPDRLTMAGAALIMLSGLYSFARERARGRAEARAQSLSLANAAR